MKIITSLFFISLCALISCDNGESEAVQKARAEKECSEKTEINGLAVEFFGYFSSDLDSIEITIKRNQLIFKTFKDKVPEKIVDSIQIRLKQQLIEADVPPEQAKEIVSKVTKEVRSDLKTEVFEDNFEADLLEYDVALNKTRAIIQKIIDAELDDEETILMLM